MCLCLILKHNVNTLRIHPSQRVQACWSRARQPLLCLFLVLFVYKEVGQVYFGLQLRSF